MLSFHDWKKIEKFNQTEVNNKWWERHQVLSLTLVGCVFVQNKLPSTPDQIMNFHRKATTEQNPKPFSLDWLTMILSLKLILLRVITLYARDETTSLRRAIIVITSDGRPKKHDSCNIILHVSLLLSWIFFRWKSLAYSYFQINCNVFHFARICCDYCHRFSVPTML